MEIKEYHQTLNRILEERDNFFPKRDPQNTALMRKTLEAYTKALLYAKKQNWEPDMKRIESAQGMIGKAVFICGYMKSGTTLLLQLLYGHPKLTVMPGDLHMIDHIHKQRNMRYEERLATLPIYWISRLVNPTGQKSFWIMGENDEIMGL